jgi:aconitate hydratase
VSAVIAKSFAQIHWQNPLNFGILSLAFADPDDCQKIELGDVRRANSCQGVSSVRG